MNDRAQNRPSSTRLFKFGITLTATALIGIAAGMTILSRDDTEELKALDAAGQLALYWTTANIVMNNNAPILAQTDINASIDTNKLRTMIETSAAEVGIDPTRFSAKSPYGHEVCVSLASYSGRIVMVLVTMGGKPLTRGEAVRIHEMLNKTGTPGTLGFIGPDNPIALRSLENKWSVPVNGINPACTLQRGHIGLLALGKIDQPPKQQAQPPQTNINTN